MEHYCDCLVLGAGIAGVLTALHLQMAGRRVVLIDNQAPGMATSFGNAGLIQRDGMTPHMLPQSWLKILQIAINRSSEAHIDYGAALSLAPWIFRFWRSSKASGLAQCEKAHVPLVALSVKEHAELATAAGCSSLLLQKGYIRLHRDAKLLDEDAAEMARLKENYDVAIKNRDELATVEPHLQHSGFVGGIIMCRVGICY